MSTAVQPPSGHHRVVRRQTSRLHVFGRPEHIQPAPVTVQIERWISDCRAQGYDPTGRLSLRERVENVVESLIELLDAIDGDAEAEESCEGMCRFEDEPHTSRDDCPGDPQDAEEESDLGAAEDEGVGRFPPVRLGRIGCPVFEGI